MLDAKYPTQDAILNDIVDPMIFDHRVIVAGSRGYNDYEDFKQKLLEFLPTLEGSIAFFSGMCKNSPDEMIIRFCEENPEYRYFPFPADWKRWGRGAGMIRNGQMIKNATALVAFHDMKSKGTANMIDLAKEKASDKEIKEDADERIAKNEFQHLVVFDVSEHCKRKPVLLFTIECKHRLLAEKLGIKFVDISESSGVEAFAPDRIMMEQFNKGEIDKTTFLSQQYRDKMTNSRRLNRRVWKHLTNFKALAFGCHCDPKAVCHRTTFVKLVSDYFDMLGIPYEIMGEITPEFYQKELEKINEIS